MTPEAPDHWKMDWIAKRFGLEWWEDRPEFVTGGVFKSNEDHNHRFFFTSSIDLNKKKSRNELRDSGSKPPTREVPNNSINLIGSRFGRFEVVGLARMENPGWNKAALWVVRCSCGKFEKRKAKAIRNPRNDKDCCAICQQVQFEKRRSERLDKPSTPNQPSSHGRREV